MVIMGMSFLIMVVRPEIYSEWVMFKSTGKCAGDGIDRDDCIKAA